MTLPRAVLAVLAALFGTLAVGAPAGATLVTHAQLVSTSPADGDVVDSVAEVTLTFSEDVNAQFVQVRVEGPTGDEAEGTPSVDGRDVVQGLPSDLAPGEHRVTYRVVSVDGHPVSGTFAFTTTEGPATPSPTASATGDAPSGSPTASPAATAAPTVAGAPASALDDGTPEWVVPLLAVLVLVPVLAGAALLLRRRRKGPTDTSS